MKAYLVIEGAKGKPVKKVELEDRGESKNFKKLGVGKFDRQNGSDVVVVQVYYSLDEYSQLEAE